MRSDFAIIGDNQLSRFRRSTCGDNPQKLRNIGLSILPMSHEFLYIMGLVGVEGPAARRKVEGLGRFPSYNSVFNRLSDMNSSPDDCKAHILRDQAPPHTCKRNNFTSVLQYLTVLPSLPRCYFALLRGWHARSCVACSVAAQSGIYRLSDISPLEQTWRGVE